MEETAPRTPAHLAGPSLIDLSAVTLERLAELDDSVLARSLGRVIGAAHDPDDVVAAFNACL